MTTVSINWQYKHFKDVSPYELYAILRLRSEVFVVEQNCVFLDMDNKDQLCYHLMGWDNNVLVASARIVPPNTVYTQTSIGRVVNSPSYRNTGAGKQLVRNALTICCELFGNKPIKIGAQLYLKRFYGTFGFVQTGDVYDEDGIDHIEMTLNQPII